MDFSCNKVHPINSCIFQDRIGSGAYTTVYRMNGTSEVSMKSACIVKHAMSEEYFPKHRVFPKVRKVLITDKVRRDYEDPKVYITEHLRVYTTYDELYSKLSEQDITLMEELIHASVDDPKFCDGLYENLAEISDEEIRDVLIEALEFIDEPYIGLDLKPENVGVNRKGELVLFDIFYEDNEYDDYNYGLSWVGLLN